MEADELLPNVAGPPVVLTCTDDDISVTTMEDSTSKVTPSHALGISAASVSGVVALDDTSVNMSIE